MRELNLAVRDGSAPKYLRLAEAVRLAIEGGQLRPGELIPSTRQLAERNGLHRHTVMNALSELVAEGWLQSEPGRGYRVVAGLPRYFASKREDASYDKGPARGALSFDYAFPSGEPDLRLFPTSEYYAVVRDVMRTCEPRLLLGQDDAGGSQELLVQLGHYLRRLRDITSQEIVVTHGSQEGIFLAAKLLVRPGDVVAVDELGYPPAWEILKLLGAKLVPLPVDRQGVKPEALAKLAATTRVALLYTTVLHQFPTTVTMPLERRRELYGVASANGIYILEDDYDHEFHYRSRPLAPLRSRDPAELVFYVSSFSKVVYPSARLGFVVPPPAMAARLKALKRLITRQNNTLIQLAQARWMEGGGFERHLRRMRRAYQARLVAMQAALRQGVEAFGLPIAFEVPDGGMSLWVDFGLDSTSLARAALAKGVQVEPGDRYRLDGKPSTFLRLGFASSSLDEIDSGIALLLQAAKSMGH